MMVGGVCRAEGNRGGKLDNCNSIINKIYIFLEKSYSKGSSAGQRRREMLRGWGPLANREDQYRDSVKLEEGMVGDGLA